jgi:hypothetical protein
MRNIKITFESFVSDELSAQKMIIENEFASKVEEIIDPVEASVELANLSGETLDAKEFGEYLEDYYNDPVSANIDPKSEYYAAIVSAFEDFSDESRMPQWQATDVENSDYYKEYIKLKNDTKQN